MARKAAFTEEQIIDAIEQLEKSNKTINGTNLRLQIGAGSPAKLMETYEHLVAFGKIKPKSSSEVEALEKQLEIQLELLAKKEEENELLTFKNSLFLELLFMVIPRMEQKSFYNSFTDLLDKIEDEMQRKQIAISDFSQGDTDLHRLITMINKYEMELGLLNPNNDLGFTIHDPKLALLFNEISIIRTKRLLEKDDYDEEKEASLIDEITFLVEKKKQESNDRLEKKMQESKLPKEVFDAIKDQVRKEMYDEKGVLRDKINNEAISNKSKRFILDGSKISKVIETLLITIQMKNYSHSLGLQKEIDNALAAIHKDSDHSVLMIVDVLNALLSKIENTDIDKDIWIDNEIEKLAKLIQAIKSADEKKSDRH